MSYGKFIKQIMDHGKNKNGKKFGDYIYYDLSNGKRAKCYLDGSGTYCLLDRVRCEIISKDNGKIDSCSFPFEDYFGKVQCSPGAPKWTPHIDNGKWYFSEYPHCLPKEKDFKRIAEAVCEYMELFN